jgi:uncharacterized protein YxjI
VAEGSATLTESDGEQTHQLAGQTRGERVFIRTGRIVARMKRAGKSPFRRSTYDLEIARDVDRVPIVTACIAIQLAERQLFRGGG